MAVLPSTPVKRTYNTYSPPAVWKQKSEKPVQPVVPKTSVDAGKRVAPFESLYDEFFYGFRSVQCIHNGIEVWDQVPLTLDDVMYPQLDDRVCQSCKHSKVGYHLYEVLQDHVQQTPGTIAFWDVCMDWAIAGQRNPCPDIGVFMNVLHNPEHDIGAFDRAKYGGYPVLAMEFTSRSTRYLDVNQEDPDRSKYVQYEQIGVHYFLVVDTIRQQQNTPPPFWGHQLVRGKYQPLLPDQHGRLWIAPLEISLGPNGNDLAWFDAKGNRLLSFAEEKQRGQEEKARADAAEARIRELEAELRRRIDSNPV